MTNPNALFEECGYLAVLAAEAITLWRFVSAGLLRKWLSLCFVLALHLLAAPIILLVYHSCSAGTYFRVYSLGDLADYAAQFTLIGQILQPTECGPQPWLTKKRVVVLAIILVSASGEFNSHPSISWSSNVFFQAERALSFTRCILLGIVGIYAFVTVTSWNTDRMRIYIGLTLYAISQLIFFQTHVGSAFASQDIARYIPTAVYFATLTLWNSATQISRSVPILKPNDAYHIKHTLLIAAARLERIAGEPKESEQ